MIIPARHEFKIIAGAQFDFRFEYLLGSPESRVPIDLTDYAATWTITSLDGQTTFATYTSGGEPGSSGVFFGGSGDPSNGIIDLIITATDTGDLSWTQAVYWLTMTPPDSGTIPLLQGSIIVTAALP
jgi:hypothetical protein